MINSIKNFLKSTVFKRFLFKSIVVTLVCIMIALGILYWPVARFVNNEREKTMQERATQVSAFITKACKNNLNISHEENRSLFSSSITTMGEAMHGLVVICDKEGNIIMSGENTTSKLPQMLPASYMQKLYQGDFVEKVTFPNDPDNVYFISAAKINAENSSETLGYCLILQTDLWAADYIPSFFMLFLIIVLLSLMGLFILSAVFVFNTSRPLKQMAYAAKRFAVGDFESRVHVNRDDEIGQLATAFNEMADSLAASEGIRRNFVANVSHELKTPMTTIAGYIDGILDGTITEKDFDQCLMIVSNEIKRLSRLVTSMISLSKIDSGEIKVHKRVFEIQETVFDVILSFQNDISKKKLLIEGLETEDNTCAFGDRDLIHQVIFNLVENAVKFTPEGGYIRFKISNSDAKVFVSVENSGKGILPEDLRLVFDKFYKADKSRSKDKNSMGLGLYIARTIIHLHEGNISAESEVDKFCRFTFHIDEAPRKQKEIPAAAHEEENK